MDVWALGIQNRGVASIIAPNKEDHLECEECGMCIDICPVGALTSGAYRYKTRPWEMKHIDTTCTHCGDGCRTTLGVRRADTGIEIVRGDNRDKSGINGDFLCIKGRYAFDFVDNEQRIKQPLIRKDGRLTPSSWEEAFELIGRRFEEICGREGGRAIGVIGSSKTTNEENYLLQKFARVVLRTNNIDHHRTADFPAFAAALQGKAESTASMRDVYNAPAILLIGNDPTNQHPLLAYQIRGNDIAVLAKFGSALPGAKVVCLADYANSRGASDMGLYPDLLPGYLPVAQGSPMRDEWGALPENAGLTLRQMVDAAKAGMLKALYVVGANPVARIQIDLFF